MRSTRPARRLALAGLLLAITLAPACSNNGESTPTSPPPPGGAKELDSGTIGGGESFVHTFANAGSFPYHCAFHPGPMRGSVTVDAASPVTAAAVSMVNFAFDPPNITVQPGATVTWTNNSGTPHTVTSD